MRAANSCDDGLSTAAIGSSTSPLLYLPAQCPLMRTLVPVYRVVLYLKRQVALAPCREEAPGRSEVMRLGS
jgi:hypothetical protein